MLPGLFAELANDPVILAIDDEGQDITTLENGFAVGDEQTRTAADADPFIPQREGRRVLDVDDVLRQDL